MDTDRERAKESFKDMTVGEKIKHIWQYYRFKIIIAVILIGAGISLIGNVTFNKEPEACLQVGIRAKYLDPDLIQELAEYLEAKYPEMTEDGEKAFYVDQYYAGYKKTETEEATAMVYKLAGSIAAEKLDVVIGDYETMSSDVSMSIYLDLRDVFTEEEMEKLEKLAAERAEEGAEGVAYLSYKLTTVDGRTEGSVDDVPYLICIGGGDEMIDECLIGSSGYLAIVNNTNNLDNVKAFIWSLLGENTD